MHAPLEGPGIIMREKHVLKDWHMEEGTHSMSLLRSFAKVLIYMCRIMTRFRLFLEKLNLFPRVTR